MTVLKLRWKKDGWWVFRDAMGNGQDFDAASLRGRRESYVDSWGRLNWELDDFGTLLKAAVTAETLRYVVYSYATPIAAKIGDTWVVTDEKYSLMTTQQTNKIAVAVTALNNRATESQDVSDMLEHYGA